MTPNPNPSPELREAAKWLYETVFPQSGGWSRCSPENRQSWIDRASYVAALSPQTLPAPGEVERLVEIAIMADPNREHRDYRLNPIYEEEREQFRPAVRAILASLATVAAANDEGVADLQVLRAAVKNLLPIGNDRLPGDRVIPIYVRMDELRALHALATSRSQHEGAE